MTMDNEQFKSEIRNRYGGSSRARKGRVLAGFFLLLIGVIWLMKQIGYIFPEWLFTWPMILIALGIFSGLKEGFRGGAWFIFIVIGGIFLADNMYPDFDVHRYIWPFVLIFLGVVVILRPKGCRGRRWERRMARWDRRRWRDGESDNQQSNLASTGVADDESHKIEGDDFVDITSVFGGVKKIIVSKNFKGADITCFMGGAEINLSQADIKGTARIDATNIFGGTKLIVPPTWEVKSEASAVFGGVDDKRELHTIKPEPGKVLILDGSCIFGGIEIRSY